LEIVKNYKKEIKELIELFEITKEEDLLKEIEERYSELEKKIKKEKVKIYLSGKYDKNNAIVSIYAGAGGTDACDFADMLLRMYLKYGKKHNFKTEILDISHNEEGGIKYVTFLVKGAYAYGILKGERGVHRLVRSSPFNRKGLRHTSFAKVEVLPEISSFEIKVKPEDLKIDTYRASGPGGQYVNKTESAVRITHLPTGISAACQSERLQGENKRKAMNLLNSKLHLYFEKKTEEEKERLKIKKSPRWGNQIRSYVFFPYKMVKDLRTKVISKDPEKVLDGQLDKFIEAEIFIEKHSEK